MASLVLRLIGSPFIARQDGKGWDIIHEESGAFAGWVQGNRKDAMEELRNVTAKAQLLERPRSN